MGRVGQGQVCGVLKIELRFVDGWDTWWKILEQVWIVGTHGSEFRYGVTQSVTHQRINLIYLKISRIENGALNENIDL